MSSTGSYTYPLLHDADWLKTKIEAGYTYQEIADEVGCCHAAVYGGILRAGLRRWTRPDIESPIAADYAFFKEKIADGPTLPVLAASLFVSVTTTRTWLVKHNLYDDWVAARQARVAREQAERAAARYRGPKFPRLRDIDQLKADVNERGALRVSEEIGCHVSSVIRALERSGNNDYVRRIGKGKRTRTPHPQRARALNLYAAGFVPREIAPLIGVSPSTIYNWIDDAGISRPRGRPKGS